MFTLHDRTLVFSATDISAHLACPHLEQRRLAGARPHAAPDAHAELIRRRGDAHELQTKERLWVDGAVDLAEDFDVRDRAALEAAAGRTAAAMRAGAPLIYQPTFFDGRWMGRADFLRAVGRGYEVIDTKLARAVKPAQVHQLALYSRLAGADAASVVLGDGRIEAIELPRVAALHRRVVRRVESVVEADTFPEPVAHCAVCDFQGECMGRRRAVDHLSLVAGARREQRERLVAGGVATVAALASSRPEEPLGRQAALQILSRETGEPCHRHLAADRARGYARLPEPSPGDVFFDLEGDPFERLEYLWGWWTPDRGYECAWAHDEAAERAALERFVAFVRERRARHPDMHVYHYAAHELATVRTLATRYATCEEEVDELLERRVLADLYAVVRQGLQVGEESYSLKALERHHGFVRSQRTVREGGGSIVAYEHWLDSGDPALLEDIRAYNEEDCRSTFALREWLLRMRAEAAVELGADFGELAEPLAEEPRGAPAWLPDVEALIARLGPEELLSYLLLYHRREGKPGWWRYFDLRGKTPDELVEERDAIGRLWLDRTVEPVPVKQSLDWTLRFPPQEFKLDRGSAEDPATGVGYSVVEVHDDRIVVRRGRSKEAPQPAALFSGAPIDTRPMREALMELAGSAATRFPAARALLERTPPPSIPGESVAQLCAAALSLARAVLPIQGPPGTGKTFRAARMVVAAVAAGRRVGITAPSHAAIQNLLACVEEHAREVGVELAGVYKGEGYAGEIEVVDDNAGVTPEHKLVAGTAWLFSRPDHREAFDLLLVDEAGQYALADAVAVATAASAVVLLGDPQQLPQVTQASHPGGSGASVLEHLLAGHATIPEDRGVLLTETWRMHPDVCAFVSERSYEGRLRARVARHVDAPGALTGAGLRAVEVEHSGRGQASPEEADAIAALCEDLLRGSVIDGDPRPLVPADILVVAPYNLAVRTLRARVPAGVRVGTVDRFQGQEAPVVFFALTCSTGDDVPRGLDFLFSANRLNVAVSRAQCLAVLVHNPTLLDADCRTVEHMALVDGACRFVELSTFSASRPPPAHPRPDGLRGGRG